MHVLRETTLQVDVQPDYIAATDMRLDVGANLPVWDFEFCIGDFPFLNLGDVCYIDKLLRRAPGSLMDTLKEFGLEVLSSEQRTWERLDLMIQIYCFNVVELQDVW